eukprot:SAG22_NODE_1823_length_3509_cov_57.994721_4_plen_94_part_00
MVQPLLDLPKQRRHDAAYQARQSLGQWLQENRLGRHELKFLEVVGPESGPEDLALLDDEDIAELGSAMTNVEAKRFAAARAQNVAAVSSVAAE